MLCVSARERERDTLTHARSPILEMFGGPLCVCLLWEPTNETHNNNNKSVEIVYDNSSICLFFLSLRFRCCYSIKSTGFAILIASNTKHVRYKHVRNEIETEKCCTPPNKQLVCDFLMLIACSLVKQASLDPKKCIYISSVRTERLKKNMRENERSKLESKTKKKTKYHHFACIQINIGK